MAATYNYYLVPAVSEPPFLWPKYLDRIAGPYSYRTFQGTTVLLKLYTGIDQGTLGKNGDVVTLGTDGDTPTPAMLAAASALGFPTDGFAGATVLDLFNFLTAIVAVGEASAGLQVATTNLATQNATFTALSSAPDAAAYIAAASPTTVVASAVAALPTNLQPVLTSPPTPAPQGLA